MKRKGMGMKPGRLIWILLLTGFIYGNVFGEAADSLHAKRVYNTTRIKGELPDIDGVLDDPCWQNQGEWATHFRQFLPKNYADPTRETEFKVLYDNTNLYVAIRCFDDPDSIEIQAGRRDALKGDAVGLAFDSYHDLRTAYEFDMSAAGSKIDLFMIDNNFLTNWDAVWYGKVAFEDSAWTVEMKIPLSQLRFAEKDQHVWGLHVWRWMERTKEEDQWNVFNIDAPSWADNFGELHGISNLQKQRRIELLPYSLVRQDLYPKEVGNPFADGSDFKYNVGLDGKIGLSSNFTMDFTINPDFGQVEADPSVLNLTAFETFYDEKRPFFLEGNSIFDFSINGDQLFYSRRIGHKPLYTPDLDDGEYADSPGETTILNALKVTGKTQKGLSVGVIQSITPAEKAEIDRNGTREKQTVEPWSNYFLTRLRQDFNNGNSSFGAMASSTQRFIKDKDTHLKDLPTDAFTGGVDFLHRWKNRSYFINGKVVFSSIQGDAGAITALQQNSRHYYQRPDIDYIDLDTTRTALNGYGGSLSVGKGGNGTWHYSEDLSWKSPGLDLNDLGYMRMADIITQHSSLSYNIKKPTKIYRDYSLNLDQSSDWDFGGRLIQSGYEFSTYWSLANHWNVHAWLSRNPQWRETRLLRGGPALVMDGNWSFSYGIHSDNRKKFNYTLHGLYVNVDDDASRLWNIQPGVNLRVGSRFNLGTDLVYRHNVDDAQYIDTIDYNGKNRYLLGRIDQDTWTLTLRSEYSFTPNLIVQYYVSPFISSGKYSHLKTVKNADADAYGDRYHTYSANEIVGNEADNTLGFDDSGDGNVDYSITNPDFNFYEMRSNLVLRWEFTPGSTFYFVWTHGRSDYLNEPVRSLARNSDRLFAVKPQNIFMMKLNYWFSI